MHTNLLTNHRGYSSCQDFNAYKNACISSLLLISITFLKLSSWNDLLESHDFVNHVNHKCIVDHLSSCKDNRSKLSIYGIIFQWFEVIRLRIIKLTTKDHKLFHEIDVIKVPLLNRSLTYFTESHNLQLQLIISFLIIQSSLIDAYNMLCCKMQLRTSLYQRNS